MSVRSGIFVSALQTAGQFFLQFVSTVVLARLLLPSEIGIFSVAMAVTAIFHAIRDFGIGRYLIQERDLTDDKVRTVFGVAIIVAWALAAIIFLGSDWAGRFYNEPKVAEILALLSINFVFLPFGQPALVLMRREGRYGRLAAITLTVGLAAACTSIAFAYAGFGPLALVYGALVNSGLTVILSLASRPDHLRLLPSLKEWRAVCGFGGLASAGTIVVQVGAQLPEILLGRFLGFTAVGLFSRARGLAIIFEQLFVAAVSWVTGAEFGRRRRSDLKFDEMILKVTDYTVVLGWPALIFLGIKAEAIIWVLFGENWLPAAPLVQALCVARGVQLLVSQAHAVYEGTGAVRLQLRNEIVLQIVSVALFLIGVQFSLLAVAWLRVPVGMAAVVVHLSLFKRFAGVGFGRLVRETLRSAGLAAAFACILAGLIAVEPAGWGRHPLALFGEIAIAGLVYLTLLFLLRHPITVDILEIWRVLAGKVPSLRSVLAKK